MDDYSGEKGFFVFFWSQTGGGNLLGGGMCLVIKWDEMLGGNPVIDTPIVMRHFPFVETVKQVKTQVSPPDFLMLFAHKRCATVFAPASGTFCGCGTTSVTT